MYYLEDRSQGEIAKAIGVSRSSVSRMLTDARQRGLIEIRIHPDAAITHRRDLEEKLGSVFPWTTFSVLAVSGYEVLDTVAAAAARRLEDLAGSINSLGVSWGYSVAAVVEQIELHQAQPHLQMYSLVGGLDTIGTGPSGNDTVTQLALKAGSQARLLQAPAIVESERTWSALTGESYIRTAIKQASEVQAALVGIGSVGVKASASVVHAMRLTHKETHDFEAQNPVGDISGQFFDINGKTLGPPSSRRFIGVTLDQMEAIPNVLGIACGAEKAHGVLGAIRSRVINTLVIDENLAQEVLKISALI